MIRPRKPLPRSTKRLKRTWLRRRAPFKPPSVLHPNKRYPLPKDEYDALVLRVFRRSGGFCEAPMPGGSRCMSPMVCDPHHIVRRSKGGPDTEENLLAVCRPCHRRLDGNELHWSKSA